VATLLTMLAAGASAVALALSASMRAANMHMAYVNLAIAAASAVLFAVLATRQCRGLLDKGASASEVASFNARSMGIVWGWGALTLFAIYGTGVLAWKEWWHFLLAFVAAAALSLYFASSLKKDAFAGKEDPAMLRIARTLAIVQLAGMVVVMAGLLIDGKMVRYLNPRYTDWAANNVFFFGAFAIAVISGYALRTNRHA
jgi:hypothetical protein